MFGIGALTGAFVEPFSAISGVVGTRLVAEALSRPAIVKAAAAVSKASLKGDPVATRAAMQRLQKLAAREGLITASGASPHTPTL